MAAIRRTLVGLCTAAVLVAAPGASRAAAQPPLPPAPIPFACLEPQALRPAALANAASLDTLAWAPFRRPEVGWEIYYPAVAREIGAACPPHSPAFADALARWQRGRGLPADGVFTEAVFTVVKGLWQERRPFVMATLGGQCPDAPDPAGLAPAALEEGFGAKPVQLRPAALEAYRRMRAAARAELREAAADPQLLTLFSGFRAPADDAVRCLQEQNCQGVTRARCSAHRTGLAMDINVGAAPGLLPDNSADGNRLFMARSATYRWMIANAGRFGFVNYLFEPWHWEWTGEAFLPPAALPP